MPYTDFKSGLSVADRLSVGIFDCSIHYEDKKIHIAASFGLTLPDAGIAVEQSVERADMALYAKVFRA